MHSETPSQPRSPKRSPCSKITSSCKQKSSTVCNSCAYQTTAASSSRSIKTISYITSQTIRFSPPRSTPRATETDKPPMPKPEKKHNFSPNCSNTSSASTNAANSIKRSEEHTSELQSRGHLVCSL